MTNLEGILLAVRMGHLSTVKRALSSGQLDRNLRDAYGATCLHHAARSGNLDLVKLLVEKAGHSTIATAENGALPSHDAAAAGHKTSLEYLLQLGCPKNARDNSAMTILHLSARFGHLNLLQYLVETRGMGIRDKDGKGASVVHYASAKGDLDCLEYIISVAPDMVNYQTESGATPMYFAAQNGHLTCMQHLMTSSGANPHLRAVDGMQPIHAAAQTGKLHCLIWLVQKQGVLPNERDNAGATPLHFAAGRGHSEVVHWLLSNRARCERDNLGGTPLHDAAEHGQLECAKILVEQGCDVNTEDRDFLVASDLAKLCGHVGVARFLRSVEKRGQCHNGQQSQPNHEVDKQSLSSTNTSLSSVALSDRDSTCSVITIEEEFDVQTGRYEVTESPDPIPDPPYLQIYEKLTDFGSDDMQLDKSSERIKMLSKSRVMEDENAKDERSSNVCTIGTQTDFENLSKKNSEDNDRSLKKSTEGTKISKGISPTRSLRRQSATEEPLISSPRKLQLSKSRKAVPASPTKLSPEKKELRFSSTVMVEEITQQDEDLTSLSTRNIQLVPLNGSSDTKPQFPKTSEFFNIPSPPPLTSSPPPHLQTITPNRPINRIPPPPMKWSDQQNHSSQNEKSIDVASHWSLMTPVLSPTTPSPPPPLSMSPTNSVSLTNSLPPHLQTITPNRPMNRIPPPPMKWSQQQNNSSQNEKSIDVASHWSLMTPVLSPTTPPPPPPLSISGIIQNSPTNSVSPRLSPHLSPRLPPRFPGPPSAKDLASVNLKPIKDSSRRSSNSSVESRRSFVIADLIAEIQAGATLRKTRVNKSKRINGDRASESNSPVEDKSPKVHYATDFLDNIPRVDDNGAELPDWRRRFLAKKEADRANHRAKEEYRQQKQLKAEERKYRDMPPWKVELLKKRDKISALPKEQPSGLNVNVPNGNPVQMIADSSAIFK